jgi:hypothetical protein
MAAEPTCCHGCGRDTTSKDGFCDECRCGPDLKKCVLCGREHRVGTRLCDECRGMSSEDKYHGEGYEG